MLEECQAKAENMPGMAHGGSDGSMESKDHSTPMLTDFGEARGRGPHNEVVQAGQERDPWAERVLRFRNLTNMRLNTDGNDWHKE